MTVPTPVEQLHKANALLHQPARQQHIVGKTGLSGLRSIHFMDIGGLVVDVHGLRNRQLHFIRHFVLRDTREYLGIAESNVLLLVDLVDGVDRSFSYIPVHTLRVLDKQHGISLAATLYALVYAGQKTATPYALAGIGEPSAAGEHDKAGQILILRTQPICHPRSHAGSAKARATGLNQQLGGSMIELVGGHRLQKTKLIGNAGQMWHMFADPGPALPPLLEMSLRAQHLGHTPYKGKPLAFQQRLGTILPIQSRQSRFIVEQLQLRRRTRHMQIDNPFGTCREHRHPWRQWMSRVEYRTRRRSGGAGSAGWQ